MGPWREDAASVCCSELGLVMGGGTVVGAFVVPRSREAVRDSFWQATGKFSRTVVYQFPALSGAIFEGFPYSV